MAASIIGAFIYLGVALLAKCIARIAFLGLKALAKKIKERLKNTHGGTVTADGAYIKKIIREAAEDADKVKLSEIDSLFEDGDMILVDMDDGTVEVKSGKAEDSVEIIRPDQRDRELDAFMDRHGGIVVVEG